ncbi:hypothetical protein [Trinickia violacea]|uniref:hypothetical protein n=1 Tax=Trinickia violacea TaxID=2571746 RepID=UPI0015860662|nr:hypothetical protein [Trinickia violacea]
MATQLTEVSLRMCICLRNLFRLGQMLDGRISLECKKIGDKPFGDGERRDKC